MTTEFTQLLRLNKPDFRDPGWGNLINDNADNMDRAIAAALAAEGFVTWHNATHFDEGTVALDTLAVPSSYWICNVSHTSANTPTTFAQDRAAHPTFWTAFIFSYRPRGAWAHDTQYLINDIAYDSVLGITGICKIAHISNHAGTINDDITNWDYIVSLPAAQPAANILYSNANIVAAGIPITGTTVQTVVDQLAITYLAQKNNGFHTGSTIFGYDGSLHQDYNATVTVRTIGNNIEWGHVSSGGYGSVLGNTSSVGTPFLGFNTGAGTTAETFRTRGHKGSLFRSDMLGGFDFATIANSNADNQAAVSLFSVLPADGGTLSLATIPFFAKFGGGVYNVFYSGDSAYRAILIGSGSDKTTYHRNNVHDFSDSAAAQHALRIDSGICRFDNPPTGVFASGTALLFPQTSAPTGWTKQTTHNDKVLRVVSGAASSGGTNAFSTVMAQTATGSVTLSTANMPAHTHSLGLGPSDVALTNGGIPAGTPNSAGATGATGSNGSGTSHNHTFTMAMQYVDVIIATKD